MVYMLKSIDVFEKLQLAKKVKASIPGLVAWG